MTEPDGGKGSEGSQGEKQRLGIRIQDAPGLSSQETLRVWGAESQEHDEAAMSDKYILLM